MPRCLSILVICTGFLMTAYSQGVQFASSKATQLTPAELSSLLTAGKTTELEKVSAIFHWITGNIDYRSSFPVRKGSRKEASVEDDTSTVLKPLNERVSEIVLRNRMAVCDGYARLFKTLCDYAGIRAVIVTGFVRNQGRGGPRFQSNHSWNAVMIDGQWKLLDATWATGYVAQGQFVRHFDPDYFLTDPRDMIYTHYPENPRWTLLQDHRAPSEFSLQPLKYFAAHKFYLKEISPAAGKIEIRKGGSVDIEFETSEAKKDLLVSSDPFLELSPLFARERKATVTGNKVRATYFAESHEPEWIYVVLNGEIIMRYQLFYKGK